MKRTVLKNGENVNESGSVLIGALIAIVILSVLGIALLNISETGIRNSVAERKYHAVYYIAESGINRSFAQIQSASESISATTSSHEEFFTQLEIYLDENIDGAVIDDFSAQFGESPEARLSVTDYRVIDVTDNVNYSDMLIRCSIRSLGIIGDRSRSLSASLDISHRAYISGGTSEPAFDYTIYMSSTQTLELSSGTNLEGILYGYDVQTNSSNERIYGDIISLTNVDLASGTYVTGNIYACGMYGSDGDVYMRPSRGTVSGNIHAKGDVTISSRCTVGGNVFSGGNIYLLNSQNRSQGIQGNAYADRNILAANNTNISGISWAGGTVNEHMRDNINAGYPPLIAPECPDFIPIEPPSLTEFEAGTEDITLLYNWQHPDPQEILPGAYGDLQINYGNTVRFSSGNYYFNNINANSSSIRIQLDLSDGPINIYVKGDAEFGSSLKFEVSENGNTFTDIRSLYDTDPELAKQLAGMVYFEVQGDLEIGPASGSWFGSVLIGENFSVGNNALLIGSFVVIGGSVDMDSNPVIIYAPPGDSAAGSGSGSSGGTGGTEGSEVVFEISDPIRED